MNKTEFLKALEEGLYAASPEERVAALQYYTEYLDEAGPEREAEVLEELGSPQKLASDILAASAAMAAGAPMPDSGQEMGMDDAPKAPDAPNGWQQATNLPVFSFLKGHSGSDAETRQSQPPPHHTYPPHNAEPQTPTTGYDQNNSRIVKIILLVLVCIFVFPMLGGLVGVVGGLVAAAVMLFLVPIIVGVAFVASSVALIICGALVLAKALGSGLVIIGVGVCMLGLGLMSFYAGVRLLGRTLPAMFRTFGSWVSRLFRKFVPGKG